MPKKQKLPSDIVQHWPEVFKDIQVETIPVEYLHSVRIEFTDGKIWEVDCQAKLQASGGNLDKALKELFGTYDSAIKNVDFRLNTAKVKRDIQKKTRAFLKNRKPKT